MHFQLKGEKQTKIPSGEKYSVSAFLFLTTVCLWSAKKSKTKICTIKICPSFCHVAVFLFTEAKNDPERFEAHAVFRVQLVLLHVKGWFNLSHVINVLINFKKATKKKAKPWEIISLLPNPLECAIPLAILITTLRNHHVHSTM